MRSNTSYRSPVGWLLLASIALGLCTAGCPEFLAALFGDPNAVEPNTVEPNTVEPNTVEPNTVEPNTVEPNTVEPNEVVVPGNSGINGQFLGAEGCALCHSRLYETWSETRHAHALETLEAIGQGENAACLGCHTVGFGAPGGYVDRATTDGLAGVQCENCHGAGLNHRSNVADPTQRPPVNIAASICGSCHTGAHHPTFDEWSETRHASVDDHVAERFEGGDVSNCGVCHSGDYRLEVFILGGEAPDDLLEGVAPEDQNAVTCAVCHDPHEITGNGAEVEDGHDSQLRYPEVAYPDATNDVDEAQDPNRFNACGQCHHSRGRTWTSTSRGPHHSIQGNMYVGEMPVDDGEDLLIPNNRSVHAFVPKQCVTCHMHTEEFVSEEEPAITGHSFHVVTDGCSAVGCHPSVEMAEADMENFQAEVQDALDAIAARLGDLETWGYSSEGGPPQDDPNDPNQGLSQDDLSDNIKQIRFLYDYVSYDGSLGVHNPEYVRDMIRKMEELLDDEGL